jgi:hypothetical protein
MKLSIKEQFSARASKELETRSREKIISPKGSERFCSTSSMPEIANDYQESDKKLGDSTNTLEKTKSAKYMTAISSKVSVFKFIKLFIECDLQRSDKHV